MLVRELDKPAAGALRQLLVRVAAARVATDMERINPRSLPPQTTGYAQREREIVVESVAEHERRARGRRG